MSALRSPVLVLLAGLIGVVGGALWLRHATAVAWTQGYAAGEAALSGHLAQATEQARASAQRAAEQSGAAILELEKRREALQDKLDQLNAAISSGAGSHRQCLDADLLRALSRTGVDGTNTSPGSRNPRWALRKSCFHYRIESFGRRGRQEVGSRSHIAECLRRAPQRPGRSYPQAGKCAETGNLLKNVSSGLFWLKNGDGKAGGMLWWLRIHLAFIELARKDGMLRFFLAISAMLALGFAAQAAPKPRPAQQCYSVKETRERIARLKLANPLMLMQAAARRHRAQPLRSRLCRRGNLLIYTFVLLRRDGKVLELVANAKTGKAVNFKPAKNQ